VIYNWGPYFLLAVYQEDDNEVGGSGCWWKHCSDCNFCFCKYRVQEKKEENNGKPFHCQSATT